MTAKLQQAFTMLLQLPPNRQDELAEALEAVALPTIDYSADQRAAVDEGLADAEAGRFVTADELQATMAKFGAA